MAYGQQASPTHTPTHLLTSSSYHHRPHHHSPLSRSPRSRSSSPHDSRRVSIAPPSGPSTVENGTKNQQKLIAGLKSPRSEQIKCPVVNDLKAQARWIARYIGPFADAKEIFLDGVAFRNMQDDRETYENRLGDLDEDESKARRYLVEQLFVAVDKLRPDIDWLARDADNLELVACFLGKHAAGARNDDNGTVKDLVLTQILPVAGEAPPPPTNKNKSERGWSNLATARMLCPRELIEEFDRDPKEFSTAVLHGEISIHAKQLPMFLYDEEDPEFSLNNLYAGLMRSTIVLACVRGVISGGRTADKPTPGGQPGKKSIAGLRKMNKVVAANIAYILTLMRYAISGVNMWAYEDGAFYLPTFHQEMLSHLSDPDDPWVKEIMEYFNLWVLGSAQGRNCTRVEKAKSNGIKASGDLLREQRAARLAKIAAEKKKAEDRRAAQAAAAARAQKAAALAAKAKQATAAASAAARADTDSDEDLDSNGSPKGTAGDGAGGNVEREGSDEENNTEDEEEELEPEASNEQPAAKAKKPRPDSTPQQSEGDEHPVPKPNKGKHRSAPSHDPEDDGEPVQKKKKIGRR